MSRRKYARTQNFVTFNIFIYGRFLQNFMLLSGLVVLKLYGHFGMEHCTKNKILVKILKNRIRHKIKRYALFLLKLKHKLILIVEKCWKSQILKFFKFGPPTKKNLKFSLISPIFGQKLPNRDLLIYFHTWNFLAFKIYIYMWHILAKCHGCRKLRSVFMALLGSHIDRKSEFSGQNT